MDDLVKFLKGFSIQVVIEVGVVVWLLMAPIRSDIAKHEKQIEATNQRLDQLYTTMIQMLESKK